jgi:hypothetical protein
MPDKSSSPTPRRSVDVRTGAQLRAARQARGLTIEKVALATGERLCWLLLEPEHLVDGRVEPRGEVGKAG